MFVGAKKLPSKNCKDVPEERLELSRDSTQYYLNKIGNI
jgi:hypothetical protein